LIQNQALIERLVYSQSGHENAVKSYSSDKQNSTCPARLVHVKFHLYGKTSACKIPLVRQD